MFAAVTVHSIAIGTDSITLVMRALYLVAGVSVALLTAFRVATAKQNKRQKTGAKPAARPAPVQ